MTRSEVWRWAGRGAGLGIGLLVVLTAAVIAFTAGHVLVLVVVSILAAASLDPLVVWVRRRFRLPRGATVLGVYALFVVAVAILLLLIVPAALNQMDDLSARLPALLADIRAWAETAEPAFIGSAVDRLAASIEANMARAQLGPTDSEMVVSVGLTFAEAVISVITLLSLTFFWLIGRETMQRFALSLLPADRRRSVREGWNQVEHRLGLWMRGQLTLMVTIGVATTIAYFVLGLENALLLGLIAGIAEIIPIVGPAIGAIPALISALITGGPELALIVAVVYVIIQTIEGNVLVPMVMRNAVGLPPFIVIVSLLIGAAVGGLIGALLAVPAAAALVVVLERVQAREEKVPIAPGPSREPDKEVDEEADVDADDEAGVDAVGAPRPALDPKPEAGAGP